MGILANVITKNTYIKSKAGFIVSFEVFFFPQASADSHRREKIEQGSVSPDIHFKRFELLWE